MSGEIAPVHKRFIANVTCKPFDAGMDVSVLRKYAMDTLVCTQISPTVKPFITNITRVRFDNGMGIFVSVKRAGVSERTRTHVTDVWFYTAVNTFVSRQIAAVVKAFITNFTYIRSDT